MIMSDQIDTSNKFNVQRRRDATVTFGVLATLDAMPLSLDDALNIAAWLALKADPGGEHFKSVLSAIQTDRG